MYAVVTKRVWPTMQTSLSRRIVNLGEKIERQRLKSEKVLQHAQAALKRSEAARQHFLDVERKLPHQQGSR